MAPELSLTDKHSNKGTGGATAAVQAAPLRAPIPFFRPDIGDEERAEVDKVLRSGWITSGPTTERFQRDFATAVCAPFAIAVNSCTAALHLAVEALGLRSGEAVLVPTMTFAATAEIVRYQGAIPVLVDCDPETCNIDIEDAERKIQAVKSGKLPGVPAEATVRGIIPVHVGGLMCDMARLKQFARDHRLWIVEDAAHAFPAAWRGAASKPWRRCGERTADVTCFSFYANKTITTGEGGMAVCSDEAIAQRMKLMCLHGLSHDAWGRYSGKGPWDYRIVAPGFKYNMADPLAAIGVHQVAKAERLRVRREALAAFYSDEMRDLEAVETPPINSDRIHAWHLYPIRLRLDCLRISRNEVITALKEAGIGCSVHWRPLHLHPYYRETFDWSPVDCPVASEVWERLISLPLFPSLSLEDAAAVVETLRSICRDYAR